MFVGQDWYEYLDEPMRDLVDEAYYLLDREQMRVAGLHDYSFVVFPIAKAYEGFLKKFFFDLKLIGERELKGRFFRIGRSLNPSLPKKLRNGTWIYDNLESMCEHEKEHEGKNLAAFLWNGWKEGRNKIFHYFVDHEQFISLEEAGKKVELIRRAMEESLRCKNLVELK